VAIALLANTLAAGAVLIAIILAFGPVSGAHLNPAVTLAAAWVGGMPWREVRGYVAAQVFGAVAGVVTAHAMFGLSAYALASFSHTFFLRTLQAPPQRVWQPGPFACN
jgi:glycerol uptake facilitator-like aquaporin